MKGMIVGLGYKALSGKDTVGKLMAARHGFRRVAFADKLKLAAGVVLGFNHDQLHGDKKEVTDSFWGFTPRWALQRVGDGFRQCVDPEVWIKAALRDCLESAIDIVVTDVRYRNEVDAIHKLGGYVVRIDRQTAGASGGVVGHTSEVDLDGYDQWDRVLENNGTLDMLGLAVDAMVGDLRGEHDGP